MEQRTLVQLLCVLGLFHKGLTAVIQTEPDVTAAVGDNACLNCQLLRAKDILQVTWQKVLPEGEENVATYNKYFGRRVTPDYKGKVEIPDSGLQNCSIVIKNVTDRDEGCYRCVFNAYPDGALIGNTCLKVSEQVVLSAPQREEIRMNPAEVKQSAEGPSWIILILVPGLVIGGAAVVITLLLIRKPWNSSSRRDPENKTPKKTNENTPQNKTPLMQKVNELIRSVTPGIKKESLSPKVSSATRGTNQQPSEIKTPSTQKENEQVRLTTTGRKKAKDSPKVSSSKRGINRQLF